MLPPPTPSSALTPTSRYLPPMMSNLAINANGQPRRIRHTPAAISIGRIPEDRDVQMLSPLSPDAKRRRYNSGYAPASARPVPGTPYPFPPDPRRQSLPAVRPEVLRGPSPRSSHSPAVGHHHPAQQQQQQQHHHPDSSLTLPPLQTTANTNSPRPGTSAAPASAHPNAIMTAGADPRSVEAMVMSMPFWGKLRILGKISPPYGTHTGSGGSPSSSLSSGSGPRGAIIAVEGDDRAVVLQMAEWLRDNLNRSSELDARVAEPPRGPPERSAGDSNDADVSLGAYIALVAEWHAKNVEMVDFITGRASGGLSSSPPPSSPNSSTAEANNITSTSSGAASPNGAAEASSPTDSAMEDAPAAATTTSSSTRAHQPAKPTSRPPPPHKTSSISLQNSAPTNNPTPKTNSKTPLLILPSFTLSAANAWAARIPIADAYSPADHWQWLATLWRGIVGPDVTVYVADPPPNPPSSLSSAHGSGAHGHGHGHSHSQSAAGGVGPAGMMQMQTPGLGPMGGMAFPGAARPVEVREEGVTRCVVVRRASNASAAAAGIGRAGSTTADAGMGMGIDESALRRLGFEVEELVRCCVGR